MSESIFASIIDEMAERNLARYSNIPPFKTSKKHDRAMQRIFKRYERNTRKLRPRSEIRIRTIRRRISVALMVIILAVVTGFTAAYFISRSFRGEIYSDNTQLFPIYTENCPTVIEEKYYLPELPKGFEFLSSSETSYYESIIYENEQTNQTIMFEQWTKPSFDSTRLNTEKGKLEEVEINGRSGVFLEVRVDADEATCIIWDNGDYILKLLGNLSKDSIMNLAKSAKILERTYN